MLSSYVGWLRKNANLSTLTLKLHMVTVKNFLEFCDIEISPRKFKNRVKLPRAIRKFKEALTKEDIIKIINGCSNNKLKTYLMFLAATGCRATETLSIRLDLDFTNSKVFIRGEHTKTREDRYVFLTKELIQQLKDYILYKYRKPRIGFQHKNGKSSSRYFTPERNENDLVFSNYNSKPNLSTLYVAMSKLFNETLDRIGFRSR
jgi:integrase